MILLSPDSEGQLLIALVDCFHWCSPAKGQWTCPQAAQAYTAKLAKRGNIRLCIGNLLGFSKILEYCYYCENKVYLSSVHRVLVCCVHLGRNYTEGWFLRTLFASRSQSHPNKIFSLRDSSSPNATKSTYSGTPLIRPPTGQNKVVVLTGWWYYRGRVIFRSKHVLINVYFKHIRASHVLQLF